MVLHASTLQSGVSHMCMFSLSLSLTHTHTHTLTRADRLPEADSEVFPVKVDVEAHHGDGPDDRPTLSPLHSKVVKGTIYVAGRALLLLS